MPDKDDRKELVEGTKVTGPAREMGVRPLGDPLRIARELREGPYHPRVAALLRQTGGLMDSFENWCDRLRQVAVEEFDFEESVAASLDVAAFRSYFDDGFSPYEALAEEQSGE